MLKKIKLLIITIFCAHSITVHAYNNCIVQRAVFEFGSGKTKAIVADYDKCQNKVIKITQKADKMMPYQHYISVSPNKDTIIDEGVMKGIEATQEIINDLRVDCSKVECYGVATAAFRNAKNASTYLAQIKQKFNINIKIINQEEEGILGFLSGLYGVQKQVPEVTKADLVVVDIGGGSYQISFLDEDNKFAIYYGNLGAVSFKNAIIELVQNNAIYEIGTTNPMTPSEAKEAFFLGTSVISDAIVASPQMREMIKAKKYVAGVGGVIGGSIVELIKPGSEPITSKILTSWTDKLMLKSDEALNQEFNIKDGNTILPNVILVKSILNAFKQPMYIAATDNVEAILNLGPELKIRAILD